MSISSKEATARICQLLATVFDVPESAVAETASSDTLPQWDSLRHLHLITALEAEFSVEFDADEALDLQSVEVIRAVLTKHGAIEGA